MESTQIRASSALAPLVPSEATSWLHRRGFTDVGPAWGGHTSPLLCPQGRSISNFPASNPSIIKL